MMSGRFAWQVGLQHVYSNQPLPHTRHIDASALNALMAEEIGFARAGDEGGIAQIQAGPADGGAEKIAGAVEKDWGGKGRIGVRSAAGKPCVKSDQRMAGQGEAAPARPSGE